MSFNSKQIAQLKPEFAMNEQDALNIEELSRLFEGQQRLLEDTNVAGSVVVFLKVVQVHGR